MRDWLRRTFVGGTTQVQVEVHGVPLLPGTELVTCSFCHSVTPTLMFHQHLRYHARVQHLPETEDE